MADKPPTRAERFAAGRDHSRRLKAWKAGGSKGPRPTLIPAGGKTARGPGMQTPKGRKAIIGKSQGKKLKRKRAKRILGGPKPFNTNDLFA